MGHLVTSMQLPALSSPCSHHWNSQTLTHRPQQEFFRKQTSSPKSPSPRQLRTSQPIQTGNWGTHLPPTRRVSLKLSRLQVAPALLERSWALTPWGLHLPASARLSSPRIRKERGRHTGQEGEKGARPDWHTAVCRLGPYGGGFGVRQTGGQCQLAPNLPVVPILRSLGAGRPKR